MHKIDCRYFLGEKPCKFNRPCLDCTEYSPMGTRILIIKLAAMGDVLRTVSILPGLKKQFPVSHVSGVIANESRSLLKNNSMIDRVLPLNVATLAELRGRAFDLLINLDKVGEATGLAMSVQAKLKLGFGMSEYGTLIPLNEEADYIYRLGLDNDLKFNKNKKTYPELIYEACGLDYRGEGYDLTLNVDGDSYAEEQMRQLAKDETSTGEFSKGPKVGLNPGSGRVFPTKKWHLNRYAELAKKIKDELKGEIFLLGGPDEIELNRKLKERIPFAINIGHNHSVLNFAALIKQLDLVVTGDTLAMHLALALQKRTVAIFGPTCESEIDMFGLGNIHAGSVDCRPCYKSVCPYNLECMDEVTVDAVYASVKKILSGSSKILNL